MRFQTEELGSRATLEDERIKGSDLGMNHVNLRRADARFIRRLPQYSQPRGNDILIDANLYVLSLNADPLVTIAVFVQQ